MSVNITDMYHNLRLMVAIRSAAQPFDVILQKKSKYFTDNKVFS